MANVVCEAQKISKYLVGELPPAQAVDLYAQYSPKFMPLTCTESWVWQLCLLSCTIMFLADGFFAIFNRFSGIRQRIFVMCAILETQPSLVKYFLP